jgi:hypothetical protein
VCPRDAARPLIAPPLPGYSRPTIDALLAAALELAARGAAARGAGAGAGRVAFVSTPSLYFALPAAARAGHAVLDIDTQWAGDGGFIHFDFAAGADALPAAARGAFDVVVIDPPFITEPVWRAYAAAAAALLRAGGAALLTTVAENAPLLAELFAGARRVPFQPSIPRLVYQYDAFCTAADVPAALAKENPEVA